MGKNRRSKFARKGKNGGKGDQMDDRDKRANVPYSSVSNEEKTNAMFEKYYKAQNLIPDGEFDLFLDTLRRELPVSFRFVGYGKTAETLRELFMQRYMSSTDGMDELFKPVPQKWYPNELAYQMRIGRKELRQNAKLKGLHNFLITETELGYISRQETVSMLPPLLLDVQPHHYVLDVCAAPGSKTAQLIEALHQHDQAVPDGMVVANDIDNGRCYLLVKQALRRLPSACAVVVNEDATQLPNMSIKDGEGKATNLQFDRVLCDVMCSGDGTLRKYPDGWKKWSPLQAIGLHKLQFNMSWRGLQLLKVGGRLVYSTCSLNPIEDEAVILHLLRAAKGAIQLVDVSDQLPTLKRTNGVRQWKVMDRDGTLYERFQDVPENKRTKLHEHLFANDAADEDHLDRCLRILPHAQDTGGFFVAVIEKTGLLPGQTEKSVDKALSAVATKLETNTNSDVDAQTKHAPINGATSTPQAKKRRLGYREEPFVFFDDAKDERWTDIRDHYAINSTFAHNQLLCRTEELKTSRNVYYVNRAVKSLLDNNAGRVKFINAGVRLFGRVESKYEHCRFRMAQEGARILHPYMGCRSLSVSAEHMKTILLTGRGCDLRVLPGLGEAPSGSVLLVASYNGSELLLCTWKGQYTIAPYADKDTRVHLLRMLGHDTTQLEHEMVDARRTGARHQSQKGQGQGQRQEDTVEGDKTPESEPNGHSQIKAEVDTAQWRAPTDNQPTVDNSAAVMH